MTVTGQVIHNAGGGGESAEKLTGGCGALGSRVGRAGSNPDLEGGMVDKSTLNHNMIQMERNSESLLSKCPFQRGD